MLKSFLKREEAKDTVFPLQVTAAKSKIDGANAIAEVVRNQSTLNEHLLSQIASYLLQQAEFIQTLEQSITPKLLELLVNRYAFEPTEKYKEEAENKKKYINQLDEYLKERKEINETVENDLQHFLQDTTLSLSKALENFSQNIHSRIREAEKRYGIEALKSTLLDNNEKNDIV